jgi:hypothetical protein
MDRVPSPDDALPGLLACENAGSSGDYSAQAIQQFHEPPALRGRSDIDMALVEALRHAMDPDQGGRSTPRVEPPALTYRCDIDTAMVEALRQAMVGDPLLRHA